MWAKCLQAPPDRVLTDEVLSYSPCLDPEMSSATVAELSAEIQRLFSDSSSMGVRERQVVNERRRVAHVLELTMSEGFICVVEDVRCEILRRRDELEVRAQRFDSMRYLSVPLRPQLLENRATLLMIAVEILRMMEDRSAINERVAKALILSVLARRALDNPDTQRYLSLWSETDRAKLARCWPTGQTARLKVREILAQKRLKRRW
jgi:hypothetical protein